MAKTILIITQTILGTTSSNKAGRLSAQDFMDIAQASGSLTCMIVYS